MHCLPGGGWLGAETWMRPVMGQERAWTPSLGGGCRLGVRWGVMHTSGPPSPVLHLTSASSLSCSTHQHTGRFSSVAKLSGPKEGLPPPALELLPPALHRIPTITAREMPGLQQGRKRQDEERLCVHLAGQRVARGGRKGTRAGSPRVTWRVPPSAAFSRLKEGLRDVTPGPSQLFPRGRVG